MNKLLLGKDFSKVNPDVNILNHSAMYDLNMNYYTMKSKRPHSPAAWHAKEKRFFHPWSLEESGKMFAYNKLSELITLKDFMTLPNCVVEQVLDGLIVGGKMRADEDAAAMSMNTAEERETRDLIKSSEQMLKQLGDKK